jgi:hypothetical protein
MLSSLHLKRRLLSFEARFTVARTFTRYVGKEGTGKSGYSPAGAMDWRAIHAARAGDRKEGARKTRMLQL